MPGLKGSSGVNVEGGRVTESRSEVLVDGRWAKRVPTLTQEQGQCRWADEKEVDPRDVWLLLEGGSDSIPD